MFEPTETETREELDKAVEVLLKIHEEAFSNPDKLHSAPHNAVIVALGTITLKIGSAFSLGITTVSIADVIDYGELKFGTRNE